MMNADNIRSSCDIGMVIYSSKRQIDGRGKFAQENHLQSCDFLVVVGFD